MIKVSGISHKRSKESYPILIWFMFQKICLIYCYSKNKEKSNTSMIITIMAEHEKSINKTARLKTHIKGRKNQTLLEKMNIPSNLNTIQSRATQLFNCDKIGFNTNESWNKFICNYKFFSGEQM